MQAAGAPPRRPEDIHSILSRFQAWTGNRSSSNGHSEIREIPMEQAIEEVRQRRRGAGTPAVVRVPPEFPRPEGKSEPDAKLRVPAAVAAPAAEAPAQRPAKPAELKGKRPAQSPSKSPKRNAKMQSAAAKPAQPSGSKAFRARRQKPTAAPADRQAFRELLTRNVRAAAPAKGRGAERQQRISVRLSEQEEQRLQSAAAKAGLTVSEYLRRCALAGSTATPAASSHEPAASRPPRTPALFETSPAKTSVLGDWISLLRNRFLASPARIAERA